MIDGVPASEMTKEQLEDHIMRMRDELDREREERNFFLLERDKINEFWEISKDELAQTKAEVRLRDRQLEEAEERHQVEIKVYKQKVKHLLYEHQNSITELKAEGSVSVKLEQDEDRRLQATLRRDKRQLKVDQKESELAHIELVKTLKKEHEEDLKRVQDEFSLQAEELRDRYETKMKNLREELDVMRKSQLHEIEQRKNEQINQLMRNHEKAFAEIKGYYNDITLNNLALINQLKEQLEALKGKNEGLEKQNADLQAQNQKIREPMDALKEENAEFRRQLTNYKKDKLALSNCKARIKTDTEKMGDLQWEHEVLTQRFKQTETERDDLYARFVSAIKDVQTKTGLKNLLLEKKLEVLSDTLEKKEVQLNEVLSASNLDGEALAMVTRKLEEVLDVKNDAIKDLQYELARVCKAHNDLLRAYQSKLVSFGIPPEDLGFQPLQTEVSGQSLGQGPAGLVSTFK
eukprot:scpid67620/ scgid6365/ Growth arrest-specific protein 8; Growth arrest-specific protein 11